MKKLYQLILKSYLGPFFLTFFISLFILLMQFLWKYIDDLVGKGLEWYVIGELLLFASASLVPLALPLAILLSSIMTFGNLGENYELVALKSAGISLQRIMFPLIIVAFFTSLLAFYFSNNLLPIANLKMGSLLYDIRQQRPALNIKPGIFYNGIDGYVIRVEGKSEDGKTLYNVLIYDHTGRPGNNKVIFAKSGKMQLSPDSRFMTLHLTEGHSYEENENSKKKQNSHPFSRYNFSESNIRFDLASFKLTRTDEEMFKDNYQMLNISQLASNRDTLEMRLDKRKEEIMQSIQRNFKYLNEPKSEEKIIKTDVQILPDILANFPKTDRERIVDLAANIARGSKTYISASVDDIHSRKKLIIRYQLEWHRKFTLSFACLVLFFIGAPLGAIIRKGGLGMPVVISVLFFVIFHVLSITGEKFAREALLTPFEGMWLASGILLPIGIFLTVKATTDSKLFNVESWFKPIEFVIEKIKQKLGKEWIEHKNR